MCVCMYVEDTRYEQPRRGAMPPAAASAKPYAHSWQTQNAICRPRSYKLQAAIASLALCGTSISLPLSNALVGYPNILHAPAPAAGPCQLQAREVVDLSTAHATAS